MPVAADIYYHYFEGSTEGAKPTVVLIHGAGGDHLHWHPNIRRLPDYRVFALDLPGHGKSGGRGQQSISAYAASILDWMEAMGLHSAVIVGHSMGSAVALKLVLDHPQHVLGLGLVGGGARLPLYLFQPGIFPWRLIEVAVKHHKPVAGVRFHGPAGWRAWL